MLVNLVDEAREMLSPDIRSASFIQRIDDQHGARAGRLSRKVQRRQCVVE